MARDPGRPKLIRERIDTAGVRSHFDRLECDATEIEIRGKRRTGDRSEAAASSLADTADQLEIGTLVAAQIRYRLDGEWWCDTVLSKGDDFRLVRMRQG